MRARAFVAPGALLLLLAAGAARAEEVLGVLAVSDPPGPGAELTRATEELRDALAARLPGVLDAATLRERMAGRRAPSSLPELDRAYAGAIAAHAAGEFEASIRTLRTIVDALEALPEGAETFAPWRRAMLRLARSEQELGRRAEAQVVLERLLRADPDVRPEARQYPPSFHALVADARARLGSLGVRRLTVESEAPARVFVEGREVGTTPVTLSLPPGRYRVSALRGTVRVPATLADLSEEDRTVQLDVAMAEVLRPDGGPGLALAAADRPLGIVRAASRLALDRAVTTSLLRDGEAVYLAATLHDVSRGAVEREGRIRLVAGGPAPGGVGALAAFLATGQASALVSTRSGPTLSLEVRPAAALPPSPVDRPAPSRARRWAVGTGLATLVAAGVTGYYARGASRSYDDARGMLDASGRVPPGSSVLAYNATIREGDRQRTAAVVAGVVTGVGLATTAILSYVSHRRTVEPGTIRF